MNVVMRNGRLTVPREARRALGLEPDAEFDVEVDEEQDALVLRPATMLRREDAWAYTAEHRALLDRAHADSRDWRLRSMTEHELADLADR